MRTEAKRREQRVGELLERHGGGIKGDGTERRAGGQWVGFPQMLLSG